MRPGTRCWPPPSRLGYRPNGAARALLTGRTNRIGVVSHGTAHFGPSSLLVALERAAREVAYSLSIVNSFEDDPAGLAGAVDSLLVQGVDAIILSEPVDDDGEPLVVDVPVLTLGTAPVVHAPTVLSVRAAQGGEAAAEAAGHLLALGHRTAHHITGPRRSWAARRNGRPSSTTHRARRSLPAGVSGASAWITRASVGLV